MASSPAASPVPLTGADCFLRAFDGEVRRTAGSSHVSQLVLRLGPGLELERLAALLAEVARAQPLLRAPVRRPYGLLPPVFRTDRAVHAALPRLECHDAKGAREPALPNAIQVRLNDRFDGSRGELLRCDVVRFDSGAGGHDVAFTWLHMLFDGAGSERFVRWLDEVGRGARAAAELPEEAHARGAAPVGAKARGDQALLWQARMRSFAARSPRSLAGPLARTRQALGYDVLTFSADETARIVARAKQSAGFLTPMLFYLAASVRAHHAVACARGVDSSSYVVPLPVNLRAKGGQGEIFGTRISLIWFQVFPEQLASFDGLLAELRAQRLATIKEGLVEAGSAAMDFARWLPRRFYARMARRAFHGELCSFFFAYTDEFLPGMTSFLGAPIENAFHAPSVPPSPGSGAVFSLRDGRLNFTHVRQTGVFSDPELAVFRAALREDLLGARA